MSRQGKTGSAVVEGDKDRDKVISNEQVKQTHKDTRLSGRGILINGGKCVVIMLLQHTFHHLLGSFRSMITVVV